jgi:hypothetical protein
MTTLGLLNFDVCFYSLKARTFLHAVPMSAKGKTATFETLGLSDWDTDATVILPHRMGAIVRHKKIAGLTSVVGH